MIRMRWLVIAALLVLAGGCAKARPQVHAEPAILQVPPAPPRVIVPPEPEPVPEQPLPEPEEATSRPPRRVPRLLDPKAAKTETAPPATAETPTAVPPVSPPAESLEPVLPTSAREVERSVRQQLQRAARDLNRVDYGALSTDGKAQYDMAKRFIQQAEQALGEKNLVFAGKLAEKAAGIASVLLGR